MSEIMRAHRWGTNAALIADVARLGYIEGSVLDATYGVAGGFWTQYRPDELHTNDLNAPNADYHEDFRAFPWSDRKFTTVVYDPPYKLNGTPADDVMDTRFGTGQRLTISQRLAMIHEGAQECWRITDKWLLVKCMDQVVSGQMNWQTIDIALSLMRSGARLKDRFDFLTTPRAQPGNRPQQHARSNYSTLLVFVRLGQLALEETT